MYLNLGKPAHGELLGLVMCKARLGLKAWAWAQLWGLRLTEISGPALVLGLGLAWAWLGLGQGFARAK